MKKTMLERLLGHLHRAVFDTTPDKVTAFTLEGPEGSSWVAANELFDITFADGDTLSYDLNNYTISQFIKQLTKDGMTVTSINSATLQFSAITMLELEGQGGERSPIVLYRDIIHAIFGAYSREIRAVKDNIGNALAQMSASTAEDAFLDEWGEIFGVDRGDMDDAAYQKFIPEEAFRLRVNGYAIEKAILDETGFQVTIEEPWNDIFRLDISRLSGQNRFYNGEDVGYFLIRPVAYTGVDWDKILPIIERNKAAGVVIMDPEIKGMTFVDDPLAGYIWWQNWSMYGAFVTTDNMAHLDDQLVLSGDYYIDLNYSVAITTLLSLDNKGYTLAGRTYFAPSRLQSFYVEEGTYPIGEYHTGVFDAQLVEAYPDTPRTWRTGKWDNNATWERPYVWAVWSYGSKEQNKLFVDASDIVLDSWIEGVQGETWEAPTEWDGMDWARGSEAFWIEWFDATHKFEPVEGEGNIWEMTVDNTVNKQFNVDVSFRSYRWATDSLDGITVETTSQTGPSKVSINVINDHTWQIYNPQQVEGQVVLQIEGTDANGLKVASQLTINLVMPDDADAS